MQASIFGELVPVPNQDKLEGLSGRASGVKMVGIAEIWASISLDGWQSIRIVGVSACVIFIFHQKILLLPAHPGCPGQSPESCKMLCVYKIKTHMFTV